MRKLTQIFVLGAILWTAPAAAKNLDGRFGFGLAYLDFTGATAISLKYFNSAFLATNFLVGFNTESSTYQFGLQALRNVIMEENMNVFLGIGGSVLSSPDGTGTIGTGLQFEAILGGEFFLSGLPNLGFHFDVGLSLRSLRGTHFRTVGGGFSSGGIRYYF